MMERYSEYKESGVKWLGEIPSHWEVFRNKDIFHECKKSVGKNSNNYTLLSLSKKGVVIRNMDDGGKFPAEFDTYKVVEPRDFIFCFFDVDETPRAVGLSSEYGMITGAYTVLRQSIANSQYLYYYYLSIDDAKALKPLYTGLRKTVPLNAFMSMQIFLPPLSEQDAIVRYLDSATSEIDKAIAMQQKMIDLLNERKQIIIQNAVTKGLDENVEMKESGVEFVNEIPHNWSTRRLKFSAWIRARLGWKGLKASEYVENGYPFLSAFNIENDHMKWNNLNFINKYRYDESPEIKLKVGDLLLVKDGAGIGKCARIDELPYGESTANGSLAVITSYDMLDYRYLYYFMVSKSFKDHTELLINGMGVPHFTQGEMKKIVMPVPPQAEQQQIVTYLDGEMEKFDSAITNCQRQITLLQERKQIIINEVVTGKVRVS